jgi:hypothetical protein
LKVVYAATTLETRGGKTILHTHMQENQGACSTLQWHKLGEVVFWMFRVKCDSSIAFQYEALLQMAMVRPCNKKVVAIGEGRICPL